MNDAGTIRSVVILLGAIALIGLIGTLVLSGMGKPVSESVVSVMSGASGALAAILARTSTKPDA